MIPAEPSAGDAFARNATFATTHWSTVLAAGDSATPGSQAALERLCRACWFPLYAAEAERRLQTEPAHEVTSDTLFDQKWGVTVLAQALKSVEAEYSQSGQARVFEQLHPFLQGDCERLAYREAAEKLSMAEPAVRMAVTRLRRRYRDALRAAVAETVSNPKDIDDELHYLIRIQGQ